jgi:hypothetical protein
MKETVHGRDAIKRKDADVIKKGSGRAIPNEQWEKLVNATPAGIPNDPKGAFLPMPGKIRPVPHKKINETDY